MNKLFAALLFFCVVGASVLWWLMKTLPDRAAHEASPQVTHPSNVESTHSVNDTVNGAVNDTPSAQVLRIDTIPQGAKVEIGGVYEGVTPLDVPLKEKSGEVLVAFEGFEVYRRVMPTLAEAEGGDLNWKITLKAHASHSKRVKDKKISWLRGSKGPYFVQLKSSEESVGKNAIESQILEFRAAAGFDKISGCLVNLGAKGKWFRILAGPFETRKAADSKRVEWATQKTQVIEGFVTGRQSCI